jgi:predicted MFS family arabinose efflux permease
MTSTLTRRPSRHHRLGLLHVRTFRLLWIGETTSSFGSSVSSVALPLVALTTLHAGVLAVSLLSAAAWLPWLVVGLPAGAWVDRLSRRRVMLVADLVSIVGFVTIPVAAALGVLTMAQLLVVALLCGAATVFFQTAYRALLPSLLDPSDLMEGNAKLQGSEQVTHVAGPGAAGLIAQLLTPIGGVIVDAASFCVSAACLLRIRVDEPPRARAERKLRGEIADGLRLVVADPLLRVGAVFGCLSNFVLTGYGSIVVVFLVRTVGLSASATGLLLSAGSLGGVLGALVVRRIALRFGTARTVLICKLGVMPFGLLIPLTHRGPALAFFVVGTFVVIGGIVAGNVTWSGFIQTGYPAHMLGRISTSVQVVNYGAIPIGAVVAGVAANGLGIRTTMWIMMAGLVMSSLVLLTGPLRTLRDLPVGARPETLAP